MQRNLGANAGLDFRELADFLSAIIAREESVLAGLLQTTSATADSETSEGASASMAKLLALAANGPAFQRSCGSVYTDCDDQNGRTPQSRVDHGGQGVCCGSASVCANARCSQDLCHTVRRRTDCVATLAQEVVVEPRRAVVMQCLFNLARADLALADLNKPV